MANNQNTPLDKETIARLRADFARLYDENSQPFPGKKDEASKFLENIKSIRDLQIPSDATAKYVGIKIEELYEKSLIETTENAVGKVEMPDANTLTPETLKQFEEEEKAKEEKIKATQKAASESTEADIERLKKAQELKERYEKQRQAIKEAESKLKEEKVYAKAEEPKLEPEQTKQVEDLTNNSKADPKGTVEKLSADIQERVPDIPKEACDATAIYVVNNLRTNYEPMVQEKVVTENPGLLDKRDESAWVSDLADSTKTTRELAEDILRKAYGQDILPKNINISNAPQSGFNNYSLSTIPHEAIKIIEIKEEVLKNPFLETPEYWRSSIGSQLERLQTDGSVRSIRMSSFKSQPSAQINNVRARLNVSTGINQPLSIAGDLAKRVGKKGVTKLGTQLAAKAGIRGLAVKGLITKVTTALSSLIPLPGINLILGYIGGEILSRIPWKKIGKFLLAVPLVGAGVGLGIPLLTAGGIGMGIWAISGNATGALISRILSILGEHTLKNGMRIIIAFISLSVVIAFILFIINSGAYIVPPSPIGGTSENPYIEVQKVAEPKGPFENSDLPLKITYTITVKAKKSNLTNISFDHECKIVQEGSSEGCASPTETEPDTISPSSPYVYTYETTFDPSTKDALVINTFTVTADSGEAKSQSTSGSATITIGEPPTDCFEIAENTFKNEALTFVTNAVSELVSDYNGYASKICASRGGEKIVIKYAGNNPHYWGYFENPDVKIYSKGVESQRNADYIIFHELAHVLANYADTWYDQYLTYPGIKNEPYPYCIYDYSKEGPPPWPFSERFAEAATYYANDACGNFQQRNPAHYRFMNEVLFKP